jgi:hypothetical protein
MTKKDFLRVIQKWNIDHPYDRFWRTKYKVSLFSPEHKAMCPVDIVLEVEEIKLYQEMEEELKKEAEEEDNHFVRTRGDSSGYGDKYIPGSGNFLSHSEDNLSSEETDEMFDNIKI